MKAIEIFERLLTRVSSLFLRYGSHPRPVGKPGEWIDQLSSEERQALNGLSSDEISSKVVSPGQTWYWTAPFNFTAEEKIKTDKLSFDKKIKI